MPYYVFTRLIKQPRIRHEVLKALPHDSTATREEINQWVELSDKDQFAKYASGKCTFAQLRKSVAERRFNVKYTVLDDLQDELHEKFKGEQLKNRESMLKLVHGPNPTTAQLTEKLKLH